MVLGDMNWSETFLAALGVFVKVVMSLMLNRELSEQDAHYSPSGTGLQRMYVSDREKRAVTMFAVVTLKSC